MTASLVVLLLLTLGMNCRPEPQQESVQIRETPSLKGQNDYYVENQPPLINDALMKLPVGKIRPHGWIHHQLESMAQGFTGHLTEISPWCTYKGNAWINPQGRGEHGWEEVPYWLRGFISLGYILENQRIIDEAERWVEGVLSTQKESGFFGPRANWERAQVHHTTSHDIWPNMIMLYVLRTYYEATGDERVLSFIKKYFQWLNTVPLDQFLMGTWQHWRGGDNLHHIYWLYNHLEEDWLLELGLVNHDQTANWSGRIPTWHGVNISQGFREPAQFYQQFLDPRYKEATKRNFQEVMSKYGQVPGGMFGADENAREGYIGPRQAAETCSMVEFMHSDEMLVRITGNPFWADHCEEVAFNSLPAAMTPDLKGLHYLTAPNMVRLDRRDKSPLLQNRGDMLSYNPFQYRCCQHNVSFGWPYYTEHLWMVTRGNGLAAVFYAPCTVEARVGEGVDVTIKESTDYPFSGKIELTLSTETPVTFPLLLRVPGWAERVGIEINGEKVDVNARPQTWIQLTRSWKDQDQIQVEFPLSIRVTTWEKNKNSVSVSRGALTYSLKIGEHWISYNDSEKWPAYEVFPTTPWNYGLILDKENPEDSFDIYQRKASLPSQPFTPDHAPIQLKAKGKRIPGWGLEPNGLIEELPESPVSSTRPVETITLIPMGCARLRVSAFPRIENQNH